MASEAFIEVRPRSTGEILDDAWRLVLARPFFLLALSGPFTVPWAAILLLLLTDPGPRILPAALLLPALAATLVPLTGIGAGACQEAFRRLAEQKTPGLAECYASACRRGFDHAVARAVAWGGALLAAVCVIMPGLIVWVGTGPVHAVIAGGEARWRGALIAAGRECQRYPAKAMIVALVRPIILAFAVANLHLLIQSALWASSNLVGIDLPRLTVLATWRNGLYDVVLVLFCWLLLVPFAEAINYLLHLDARARFEGLDLKYRVQQVFAVPAAARAGAFLLVLAAGLACTGQAKAAPRAAVHQARQELAAMVGEMERAKPWPGAGRWAGRLTNVAGELDRAAGRHGCRWFREALAGFAGRNQADAVRVVRDLQARLEVWDASLTREAADSREGQRALSRDEIKALLPKQDMPAQASPTKPEDEDMPKAEPKHHEPVEDSPPAGHASSGGGLFSQPAGGLGAIGLQLLAGLCVAALVFALVRAVVDWKARGPIKPVIRVTPATSSLESLLTEPNASMAQALWWQADELAGRGQFLEAARSLYLAVLASLHGAGLIRYERVRTNHEYAAQLRPRQHLHQPFVRLTGLFELKWYGERACGPEDFAACRQLAEKIRSEAVA